MEHQTQVQLVVGDSDAGCSNWLKNSFSSNLAFDG